MDFYLGVLIKLLLSALLGAMIGLERESKNRPAGLRTNVLVCIGAALVQIINIDIFNKYRGVADVDPARLGAQVISGIGFLGAGTILREGATIKGLTTAASLWVVACIGIAIGNGSYIPAIATAVLVFLTLTLLKGFEDKVNKKNQFLELEIQMENKPGQLGRIAQILGNMKINIANIEFREYGGMTLTAYVSLKLPGDLDKQEVLNKIVGEEGIYSVEEV